ncbi:MAG: GntR family transcriptional regulator, partial [Desulfobacterales bacterium]|nr:GntR family transcriptional regulator [Desulfobacterales bacterium]
MAKLDALPKPRPLAKMAYEALKASITSGKLAPGEIYNEMALAKELNISRTPVREALLELSTN